MNTKKFDSINFDAYSDHFEHPGRRLKGVFVPKSEFGLMWQKGFASLPALAATKRYTAKQIFADPSWDDFPIGKRIALGRVLRFFVEQEMFPLRLFNPGKRGPRKYVLCDERHG